MAPKPVLYRIFPNGRKQYTFLNSYYMDCEGCGGIPCFDHNDPWDHIHDKCPIKNSIFNIKTIHDYGSDNEEDCPPLASQQPNGQVPPVQAQQVPMAPAPQMQMYAPPAPQMPMFAPPAPMGYPAMTPFYQPYGYGMPPPAPSFPPVFMPQQMAAPVTQPQSPAQHPQTPSSSFGSMSFAQGGGDNEDREGVPRKKPEGPVCLVCGGRGHLAADCGNNRQNRGFGRGRGGYGRGGFGGGGFGGRGGFGGGRGRYAPYNNNDGASTSANSFGDNSNNSFSNGDSRPKDGFDGGNTSSFGDNSKDAFGSGGFGGGFGDSKAFGSDGGFGEKTNSFGSTSTIDEAKNPSADAERIEELKRKEEEDARKKAEEAMRKRETEKKDEAKKVEDDDCKIVDEKPGSSKVPFKDATNSDSGFPGDGKKLVEDFDDEFTNSPGVQTLRRKHFDKLHRDVAEEAKKRQLAEAKLEKTTKKLAAIKKTLDIVDSDSE